MVGGVVDPAPIATSRHESGTAKCPQVVRHERLSELRGVHEIGDAAFAGGQQLEQAEAGLVAERAKAQRGNGTRSLR